MDKIYYRIYKHRWYFITPIIALLIWGIVFLCTEWKEPAQSFGDNVIVELVAGSLLSIVPFIWSYYIGRKSAEFSFYENVKSFLEKVKSINPVIGPKETRELVIAFSKTVDKAIIEKPFFQKMLNSFEGPDLDGADCGLCGMPVINSDNKCDDCGLNCRAWKNIG